MKNVILSAVEWCSSENARRFGRPYRLHLESRRSSHARNQQKPESQTVAWKYIKQNKQTPRL
jgi:hypothetical protein